ncbi:MAG TPA: hypothetical protein VIW24_19235 [Aldersonia sp.]
MASFTRPTKLRQKEKRQHRHDTEWSIMKLSTILHREPPVPLLETARMKGRPKSWPSEKLERLLTPAEIEAVLQHRV